MFGNPKYRINATNRYSMVFGGSACVSSCAFARRRVQEKSPREVTAMVSVGKTRTESEQSGSVFKKILPTPRRASSQVRTNAGAPAMVAPGRERVLFGHFACRLSERGEPWRETKPRRAAGPIWWQHQVETTDLSDEKSPEIGQNDERAGAAVTRYGGRQRESSGGCARTRRYRGGPRGSGALRGDARG